MKIKKSKKITEVDGFKLHQEIPEFDFGIIVNFEEVEGEWYVDIKDDRGSSQVSIKELKEIISN